MTQGVPPAIVVGLCAHGLAVVRGLAREGVEVHALERDRSLPGVCTRLAQVHYVSDINHEGLIPALRSVGSQLGQHVRPVLFPTNDHMVRTLADRWEQLNGRFDLSWAASRAAVRGLLDKASLETRCHERGLLYPRSWYAQSLGEIAALSSRLPYPVIVKPSRPLSTFKAVRLSSPEELQAHGRIHKGSLPFVIQEWIPGGDRQILFGALLLDEGRVRARFEGLKLRSLPRAMGQTTVARPRPDEAVHDAALRFFEGLGLSGAVSLEVKRDDQGRLWVIEPTVGRTDYWVDCCIANGVNLPYLEYCNQAELEPGPVAQRATHVWLDTEREPLAYLALAWRGRSPLVEGMRPRFAYLQANDMMPFTVSLWRLLVRTLRDLPARLSRALGARGAARGDTAGAAGRSR